MEEIRLHPSLRNTLSLIVWPLIAIPVGIWLMKLAFWSDESESMPALAWLIWIAVMLTFPAFAWIKTRYRTYIIESDTVYSRTGLLAKNSLEFRIRDIRAIHVRQTLLQRLMRIGDLIFSSAAGDEEEVVFEGVANPEDVKREVRRRQELAEQRREAAVAGEAGAAEDDGE